MPENGEVSQEDIDALLNQSAQGSAPAQGESAQEKDAEPTEGDASEASADESRPQEGISEDDLNNLLSQAKGEPSDAEIPPPPPEAKPFDFSEVKPLDSKERDRNIHMLMDVNLNLRVELGRRKMNIEDILRLGQGSVVELDKLAGDSLNILVNDRLVARGEVLVLNDNFCVRVTSIVSPEDNEKG